VIERVRVLKHRKRYAVRIASLPPFGIGRLLSQVINEILIQMYAHLLEYALHRALIPVLSVHDLPHGLPQPLVQLNNELLALLSVLVLSAPESLPDGVFPLAYFLVNLHPREEFLLLRRFTLLYYVQLMLLFDEGILVGEEGPI